MDLKYSKSELVNFFKDKRILITGNTGFKGSWLSQILLTFGSKIMGYSIDVPTVPSLFNSLNLDKEFKTIKGDISDYKDLKQTIVSFKPEIVFHMAAQSLVYDGYKDPLGTFKTNVLGTANLLESCRDSSVSYIVNVTSDKCYLNDGDEELLETNPLGGYDPYSSSKACAELVTLAYDKSFFDKDKLRIVSVRAGNVVGGGDWSSNRLLPDCIKNLHNNEKIVIRNPSHSRPWQHVLDPLYGYLKLCYMLSMDVGYKGPWNFGPSKDDVIDVESVVNKVCDLWPNSAGWTVNGDNSFDESKLIMLNSSKANIELVWNPKYNIDVTLEKTVNWYLTFYKENKIIKNFTINQIKDYFDNK